MRKHALASSSLTTLLLSGCVAQDSLGVQEYDPPSTLVVPETVVTRARFPFVDVHSHQYEMPTQDLDVLVADMDALNMGVMVNLSGRVDGDRNFLLGCLRNVNANHPSRFLVFTNIEYEGIDEPEWGEQTAQGVAEDIAAGAAGLKIYKRLGMDVRDAAGARLRIDDPRLDPIWRVCGEMGVPVLIHSGDPAPFWQPKDANNERWYELWEKPGRKRDPELDASWEEVMTEQRNVFARHPETNFISAHLGWMGNDLGRLGRVLDEHPNVMTEIGAVLAELGRQPTTAHAFFERYQDRLLFGKDSWVPAEYHVYFRVLETSDDYVKYYRRRHAFWRLYGLALPDGVLRKLYYGNALRLFPKLDRSLFPSE